MTILSHKPCRKCGGHERYKDGNCAHCQREKSRARHEADRMAQGKPVVRRLAFVPRKRGSNPWGLTERQIQVVDAFYRLGEVKLVALEMGMERSAVSQRLTAAVRQAGLHNDVLLVVEYTKWKAQQAEPVNPWLALMPRVAA